MCLSTEDALAKDMGCGGAGSTCLRLHALDRGSQLQHLFRFLRLLRLLRLLLPGVAALCNGAGWHHETYADCLGRQTALDVSRDKSCMLTGMQTAASCLALRCTTSPSWPQAAELQPTGNLMRTAAHRPLSRWVPSPWCCCRKPWPACRPWLQLQSRLSGMGNFRKRDAVVNRHLGTATFRKVLGLVCRPW